MSNEKITLTDEDLKLLNLLGHSFIKIRSIARNSSNLSNEEKLKIIEDIADASHNIPNVISQGGYNSPISFLLHDVPRLKDLIFQR